MTNRKLITPNRTTVLAICATALGAMPVSAAFDPTFDAGDLIFGVQSSTATGSVLELNLGAPLLYKSGSQSFLVGNIGLELSNLFGNTWYNDPNLFFGISGARSATAAAGSADANGDFNSTVYASRAREGNGIPGFDNSVEWSVGISAVSVAATGMIQVGNTFNGSAPAGAAVKTILTSSPNDWSDLNLVTGSAQGTAYSTFVGGIQYKFDTGFFDNGAFASLTNVEGVVDLFRITRFSNAVPGQPNPTPGVGTYIGSFAIEQDGDVYFVVPEPGSAITLGIGLMSLLGAWRPRRGHTLTS